MEINSTSSPAPSRQLAAVLQSNLHQGLKTLKGSVETKSHLPALQFVKLHGDNNWLYISASNLDSAQTIRISARIDTENFDCIVHFETLFDLIPLLAKERIDLEYCTDKRLLTIKQGRNCSHLKCIAVDDFPSIPVFEHTGTSKLATISTTDIVELKTAVSHVASFCTTSKKSNSGYRATEFLRVEFVPENQVLQLIGSDGYSISTAKIQAQVLSKETQVFFINPSVFKNAIASLDADDKTHSRISRGKKSGGMEFNFYATDEGKLVLQNEIRTVFIQPELSLKFSPPPFQLIGQLRLHDTPKIAPVLKSAKQVGGLCIHFERGQVFDQLKITDAQSIVQVMLDTRLVQTIPQEGFSILPQLRLKLNFSTNVDALTRALKYLKESKTVDTDIFLQFLLDKDGELVIALTGRNATDVFSTSIQRSYLAERWLSWAQMRQMQRMYQEAKQAFEDMVPMEYHAMNHWELPAEKLDWKKAKAHLDNAENAVKGFCSRNSVWEIAEVKSEMKAIRGAKDVKSTDGNFLGSDSSIRDSGSLDPAQSSASPAMDTAAICKTAAASQSAEPLEKTTIQIA